ncbi:hypothetical protein [Lewinella sp. LCG006]|uniref:hypothetical protein n=1 Tax=Lewinella sp. LCG006 TaxID=3231911 RepID=UPI0034607EDE
MSEKSLTVLGLIVGVIAIIVSVLIPEIRTQTGLDKEEKEDTEVVKEQQPGPEQSTGVPDRAEKEGCLQQVHLVDSVIYLRMTLNGEVEPKYLTILRSRLRELFSSETKYVILSGTEQLPSSGVLIEYDAAINELTTSEIVSDGLDVSSLKTIEILGDIRVKELEKNTVVNICPIETRLGVHKTERSLSSAIKKSIETI